MLNFTSIFRFMFNRCLLNFMWNVSWYCIGWPPFTILLLPEKLKSNKTLFSYSWFSWVSLGVPNSLDIMQPFPSISKDCNVIGNRIVFPFKWFFVFSFILHSNRAFKCIFMDYVRTKALKYLPCLSGYFLCRIKEKNQFYLSIEKWLDFIRYFVYLSY